MTDVTPGIAPVADQNPEAKKDASKEAPAGKGGLNDLPATSQGIAEAKTAFNKNDAQNPNQQLPDTRIDNKDNLAATATADAGKDSAANAGKDAAPVLSEHDKAVADFTAAGGTPKRGTDGSPLLPDGSMQFIDKNNHIIGIIYPQDNDFIHYTWNGDQLVGIAAKTYEITRDPHKDGVTDQWRTKDGQVTAMTVSLNPNSGDTTYLYGEGGSLITKTDGSYVQIKKDLSSVEHTKDNVDIHRQLVGKMKIAKITEIDYPQKDSKAPVLSRKFHYSDEGELDGYVASNSSCWTSVDGLNWKQVNPDGTPNFHKKDGKPEQATLTGTISFANDLTFKFVNLSGMDKNGNPEAPHLTAYDRYGNSVPDTLNKDNFHAEIAGFCQDYIKKTGGNQVKASDIEKTLSDVNSTGKQKVAAQFLQRMLPENPNNIGVDTTITWQAAMAWLKSQQNQESAAIAIARAFAENAQKNAQEVLQVATTDTSKTETEKSDQVTKAQSNDQAPQAIADADK